MTWLLTGYILMWPVIVLGTLIAIGGGFLRDLKTARREGKTII